jgi:hypothetical protein
MMRVVAMTNPFDDDSWDSLWQTRWADEGDPLALLLAVIHASREDRPIPHWAATVLAERFQRYLKENGSRSLDQILGLNGLGPGQDPAIKRRNRRRWEDQCIFLMWNLHKVLGLKVVEASKRVERWQLTHTLRKADQLPVLSASTLRDKYYRRHKKKLDQYGVRASEVTPDFRDFLLRVFKP